MPTQLEFKALPPLFALRPQAGQASHAWIDLVPLKPEHGLHVVALDARGLRTHEELFAALAQSLKFPDYFGANWAALNDCLLDMDWWSHWPLFLVIDHAEALLSEGHSQDLKVLFELLKSSALDSAPPRLCRVMLVYRGPETMIPEGLSVLST